MTQPVRLRRQLHREQRRLDSMQGLHFHADRADLAVATVHMFEDADDAIALSFVTGRGTVNLVMPKRLACEVGEGLTRLGRLTAERVRQRT